MTQDTRQDRIAGFQFIMGFSAMIRKSLLLFSLSILASSSVFAAVTSHKEWGVPNIKLTFNQSKNNLGIYNAYLSKAKADKTATQWLQATSKINDIQFVEDENAVIATANTSYFLGNFGSEDQFYTVTQSVCTAKDDFKEEHCSNSSSGYLVESEHAEFTGGESSMYWTDVKPGDYLISFRTSIQNDESDTIFSSYDFAFFTVPAPAKA